MESLEESLGTILVTAMLFHAALSVSKVLMIPILRITSAMLPQIAQVQLPIPLIVILKYKKDKI